LSKEEREDQLWDEEARIAKMNGRKIRPRTGSRIMFFNRPEPLYRRDPNSLDAVRARVKFIAEGVASMEKKLRQNMKSYVEGWRVICSSKFPYRTIPEFREMPWPISDGWATAPVEITKGEIKRFLFSKCNIPKRSSRAEVFNTAITFWEASNFRRNLLRCYPASKNVPEEITEGAKLVYSHLLELETEMEPAQANVRKRRQEEESSKKRRYIADVWDKFTGILRFPTSFDFNSMRSGFI